MNDRAKAVRGARSATAVTTLLQSVCDRLPVGFALFDADLALAAWNASFAALGGYPRKLVKVGTRPWAQLYPQRLRYVDHGPDRADPQYLVSVSFEYAVRRLSCSACGGSQCCEPSTSTTSRTEGA